MGGHPSEELSALTSITAAIEDTRAVISDMDIEVQDDTCRGGMCLIIPLEGAERLDDTRIDTDNARLVDAELRIDLDIEIGAPGSEPRADHRSETGVPDRDTTGPTEATKEATTDRPDRPEDRPTETRNENDDAGETRATREGESKRRQDAGESAARDASMDDLPRYRDPEELAAVYDPNATFEEMKTALDVDVTAQTVRKYMIEYGIHEPEPRQDRLLESIRPSEFELMSDEQNEQTDSTDQ